MSRRVVASPKPKYKRVTFQMISALVNRCNELSKDGNEYKLMIDERAKPKRRLYITASILGEVESSYSKRELLDSLHKLVDTLNNTNGMLPEGEVLFGGERYGNN